MPLETLPGWPEAPSPTALESLGVLFGIPAVLFVVISVLAALSARASQRHQPPAPESDAVWLHSRGLESHMAAAPKREAISAGASTEDSGGASARW